MLGLHQPAQVRLTLVEKTLEIAHLACEFGGQAAGLLDQLGSAVPLGQCGANLCHRALLCLLQGEVSPVMVGLALTDQGTAAVPDGNRRDVHKADVLKARLVHGVLRADDRAGNSIAASQVFRSLGSHDLGLSRVDVGTALEGHIDEILLPGGGDERGQCEFPKRLGGARRLGNAHLVAKVGQGRDIVLLRRLDELTRRPAFDPCQNNVGRGNLVGLEPTLERFLQLLVEVGKLGGDFQPLAPVSGCLKKAIGLNQGQKLRLHHGPFLLLVRGLGDVVAVGGLMSQLQRLAKRKVEIKLTEL